MSCLSQGYGEFFPIVASGLKTGVDWLLTPAKKRRISPPVCA
jgi:hypothetical protein